MNPGDRQILASIRDQTRQTLRSVIGADTSEVVLLDTPRHQNSGDALIWLGELTLLREIGVEVVYHADMGRFRESDLMRFPTATPILLQGGGNMGDLYPLHDGFRRDIVRRYRNRKLVVLPQSIHYASAATMARALEDYRKASDLTVLLREPQSLRLAAEEWPDVRAQFCYDAALGAPIDQYADEVRPQKALVLSRRDAEVAASDLAKLRHGEDWTFGPLRQLRWRANLLVGAAYRRRPEKLPLPSFKMSQAANGRCLNLNITAARAQFKPASSVATNRLHAHVLATLLGLPNYVADNSYGKISSIYNAYTGQFSTSHWCNSLDQAIRAATAHTQVPSQRGSVDP